MNSPVRHFLILLILLFSGSDQLCAQLEFNMSDTTVTECKGILFDNGGDGVNYLHNANETFSICLDAPGTLTLAFDVFCVESIYDSLSFHAGPSYQSPQIGPVYSGNTLPPAISITSGCLTLHFVSDASVACTGWEAHWTTQVVPPVPPQISAIVPIPACSSSTAIINLSKKLACDSVYAGAFELSGPLDQTILSAIPVNCTGDSTQQIQLSFSVGLNQGGIYLLELHTNYWDACDSLWQFTNVDSFRVDDCPIVVTLTPDSDSLCYGQCKFIDVEVTGGNGIYSYSWNNGMIYTGIPQQVCPLSNETFVLTVDDTSPAVAASGSTFITVIAPALVPSPSTHCQSDVPFILSASPIGGWWIGSGITDSLAGTFIPDSAMAGLNQPGYYLPITPTFGCTTLTNITILPIDAGIIQAACPGSAPFQVLGFSPLGGTWSGSGITSSGVFDPTATGVFVVTYSINGCSEDLNIYVDDISNVPVLIDTLCQSDSSIRYILNPPGGRWSGEGIVDSLLGTFDPGETNAGIISITYTLNGCTQVMDVFVKEIFAGWNRTACPTQMPFLLEDFAPTGGVWSGQGISDTLLGLFDPGVNAGAGFTSNLIYAHPNGCTDTTRIYVVYTTIGMDTLYFCSGEQGITLDHDNLQTNPWEGIWTGTGVLNGTNPDSSFFNAMLAGTGIHTLIFEENTCRDTTIFIVQTDFLPDLQTVCEQAPEIQIAVPDYAAGGIFTGSGIVDPDGLFDPSEAGEGDHALLYKSPQGCRDTFMVTVDNFRAATIDGPAGVLCFVDTLYEVDIFPSDALYFGDGTVPSNFFNPLLSGEGEHWIYAETGSGYCRSIDSVLVTVGPAIGYTLNVSRDTLCFGEYTAIQVSAFGGSGSLITYNWNEGLQPLQQQIVSPQIPTTYTLEITDGCSMLRDSIPIFVHPRIDFQVATSDTSCYGENSFATIVGVHGNTFQVDWQNELFLSGDTLPGFASTTYATSVIDSSSGCAVDTSITLPGYPLVMSQFSVNPDMNCIPETIKDINFIDLSSGGFQGSWNFGDGTIIPFLPGENPTHTYSLHGEYMVVLEVADSNGCESKSAQSICLKEPFKVYLPNAFTVNNDGLNEVFLAKGTGIIEFHMWVYERSGKVLFESTNLETGWDGTLNGRGVPMGVYAWIVEVQWSDKQWFTTAGTVTLIR